MDLFNRDREAFDIADGELSILNAVYDSQQSELLFSQLSEEINWKQETINIAGKSVMTPRLSAWYGDAACAYTYSGLHSRPQAWTPLLLDIKEKLQQQTQSKYNSVLLNLYRDEKDSVAWHSDDEPELGKHPTIASLSLGESRLFEIKHKSQKLHHKIQLHSGSVLLMAGLFQQNWQHQLPKLSVPCEARINLTFRWIYPE